MIAWADPVSTVYCNCTATVCTCHEWNQPATVYTFPAREDPIEQRKRQHREAMRDLVARQARQRDDMRPRQPVRVRPRVWQPVRG